MSEIVTERVVETTPESEPGSYSSWKVNQIIYYIGGVIESILAIRLILQFLGANQGTPFVDLMYRVSHPLVAPFFGIFNSTPTFGTGRLETETLVAMVVWALITTGVAQLVRLITR